MGGLNDLIFFRPICEGAKIFAIDKQRVRFFCLNSNKLEQVKIKKIGKKRLSAFLEMLERLKCDEPLSIKELQARFLIQAGRGFASQLGDALQLLFLGEKGVNGDLIFLENKKTGLVPDHLAGYYLTNIEILPKEEMIGLMIETEDSSAFIEITNNTLGSFQKIFFPPHLQSTTLAYIVSNWIRKKEATEGEIHFESIQDINKYIATKMNLSARESWLLSNYCGRMNILGEISNIIRSEERGVIDITGEPAIGKTTLSVLFKVTTVFKMVHIPIRFENKVERDPEEVCVRIIRSIEAMFQLNIECYKHNIYSDLSFYLEEVSKRLIETGEKLVIWIDGVDELSLEYSFEEFGAKFPIPTNHVFLVFSHQKIPSFSNIFAHRTDLEEIPHEEISLSALNENEIFEFFAVNNIDLHPGELSIVGQKSMENPLYLKLMLDEILNDQHPVDSLLKMLPANLNDYYARLTVLLTEKDRSQNSLILLVYYAFCGFQIYLEDIAELQEHGVLEKEIYIFDQTWFGRLFIVHESKSISIFNRLYIDFVLNLIGNGCICQPSAGKDEIYLKKLCEASSFKKVVEFTFLRLIQVPSKIKLGLAGEFEISCFGAFISDNPIFPDNAKTIKKKLYKDLEKFDFVSYEKHIKLLTCVAISKSDVEMAKKITREVCNYQRNIGRLLERAAAAFRIHYHLELTNNKGACTKAINLLILSKIIEEQNGKDLIVRIAKAHILSQENIDSTIGAQEFLTLQVIMCKKFTDFNLQEPLQLLVNKKIHYFHRSFLEVAINNHTKETAGFADDDNPNIEYIFSNILLNGRPDDSEELSNILIHSLKISSRVTLRSFIFSLEICCMLRNTRILSCQNLSDFSSEALLVLDFFTTIFDCPYEFCEELSWELNQQCLTSVTKISDPITLENLVIELLTLIRYFKTTKKHPYLVEKLISSATAFGVSTDQRVRIMNTLFATGLWSTMEDGNLLTALNRCSNRKDIIEVAFSKDKKGLMKWLRENEASNFDYSLPISTHQLLKTFHSQSNTKFRHLSQTVKSRVCSTNPYALREQISQLMLSFEIIIKHNPHNTDKLFDQILDRSYSLSFNQRSYTEGSVVPYTPFYDCVQHFMITKYFLTRLCDVERQALVVRRYLKKTNFLSKCMRFLFELHRVDESENTTVDLLDLVYSNLTRYPCMENLWLIHVLLGYLGTKKTQLPEYRDMISLIDSERQKIQRFQYSTVVDPIPMLIPAIHYYLYLRGDLLNKALLDFDFPRNITNSEKHGGALYIFSAQRVGDNVSNPKYLYLLLLLRAKHYAEFLYKSTKIPGIQDSIGRSHPFVGYPGYFSPSFDQPMIYYSQVRNFQGFTGYSYLHDSNLLASSSLLLDGNFTGVQPKFHLNKKDIFLFDNIKKIPLGRLFDVSPILDSRFNNGAFLWIDEILSRQNIFHTIISRLKIKKKIFPYNFF